MALIASIDRRLGRARPRPIVDLAKTFLVNLDQHNVTTDGLWMRFVAGASQNIFERFPQVERPEQQSEGERPPQQPKPLAERFGRDWRG